MVTRAGPLAVSPLLAAVALRSSGEGTLIDLVQGHTTPIWTGLTDICLAAKGAPKVNQKPRREHLGSVRDVKLVSCPNDHREVPQGSLSPLSSDL